MPFYLCWYKDARFPELLPMAIEAHSLQRAIDQVTLMKGPVYDAGGPIEPGVLSSEPL